MTWQTKDNRNNNNNLLQLINGPSDLVSFLESSLVQNVNLLRYFEILDGPLMSLFLMRAGMRTSNGRLYYSGLEYASLFTFPNGHKNYQLITTFELYLLKVAPPEVRDFIFTFLFYENRTHKDSDSCGEGLDYRLEEYNKKFKLYLHFLFPNFDYWITVCSNTSIGSIQSRRKRNPFCCF